MNADPATALAKTMEAAKMNPLIAEASIIDNLTVSCRFKDGVYMTVGTTRRVSAGAPPSQKMDSVPVPKWLAKGKAAIINSLYGDKSMTTYAPQIAQGLTQGGFSLVGGKVMTGTLSDYMSLADLGFFYVESHGGTYLVKLGPGSYVRHYTLLTDELASTENLTRYDAQLKSGDFIISNTTYRDANDKLQEKSVLSFSDTWLARQKWFADNAIAFFNTCNSATPPIREAMSNTNIGVQIGYDRSVEDKFATKVVKRLFELMADQDGTRKSWREAQKTLGEEGLLENKGIGVGEKVIFTEGRTPADSLLPRIDSVTVNESTLEAEVKGVFGPGPGVVMENGLASRPLAATNWTPTSFKVKLKPSTFGLMVKTGSRQSQLHYLKVWTVSGAAGGSFWVNNRVKLVLADRDLKSFTTLVDEPAGTGAGNKGPYYFHADVSKRLAFLAYSDKETGSFDDVYLTTPSGRKKMLAKGIADWKVSSDGLINVMWGYSYLDRF